MPVVVTEMDDGPAFAPEGTPPVRTSAFPVEQEAGPGGRAVPVRSFTEELASDWNVDPDRAREDLEKKFEARLSEWLGVRGVPSVWHPPAGLMRAVVLQPPSVDESEQRDYALLHRAHMRVNLSPDRRDALVSAYRSHLTGVWLGGGLVFTLAGLGIVVGYIRADEATKGYYTNRLRLAAAAGLGGAGVLLAQWILRAS